MSPKPAIDEITSSVQGQSSWRLVWVAIIIAIMLGVWFLWSGAASEDVAAYSTDEARMGRVVVTVTATGTVEPTNLVEISSELSGTIQSVEVDFNDTVESGQILARLDTEKLEAALEHSRATLAAREARVAEAQATFDETSENLERNVMLEQRGVATAQDLLTAKSAHSRAIASLTSAKADLRVAAADLKLEEANFAKACICSPIDGVVLDRNVDTGQIVASSLQAPVLFTLAEDLRRMELQVDIDEADIGKVKIGNKAVFSVEAYQDRDFPAVISQLRYAPQTIDGVVTYKAVLSIENSDLALRPGMTATADIRVAEIDDALVIPNAALRFAPPIEAAEDEGGSGLLGLLINPPTRTQVPQHAAAAEGWRTIWTLRDELLIGVDVRIGETDGSITVIREGELSVGDAVVVGMQAEP